MGRSVLALDGLPPDMSKDIGGRFVEDAVQDFPYVSRKFGNVQECPSAWCLRIIENMTILTPGDAALLKKHHNGFTPTRVCCYALLVNSDLWHI